MAKKLITLVHYNNRSRTHVIENTVPDDKEGVFKKELHDKLSNLFGEFHDVVISTVTMDLPSIETVNKASNLRRYKDIMIDIDRIKSVTSHASSKSFDGPDDTFYLLVEMDGSGFSNSPNKIRIDCASELDAQVTLNSIARDRQIL